MSAIKNILRPKSLWAIFALVELVIIICVALWALIAWLKDDDAAQKKYQLPTVTVEAKPVERTDFETFISAVGTLKANESIIVRPQEGGVIKSVSFSSGEYVKKGEVLLELEDRVLQAQLQEALAKRDTRKAEYDRAESLFAKKAYPKSKRDEALGNYKVSKASVDLMQAKVQQSILSAPFDGIVGLKDVSVGAYIKPGEEIVSLDNVDPILIDFRISEIHLDKVTVGQTVQVEIDGFSQNLYEATIEAIDPVVDAAGHSIRVRAKMQNRGRDLKPGLFARVRFTESLHEKTMIVPESAVETEGNQEFVYAVIDGIARRAPIKTGGRNGRDVEVKSGLQPGMMVVTSGQMRIGEGFPVIVVPDKKKLGYK